MQEVCLLTNSKNDLNAIKQYLNDIISLGIELDLQKEDNEPILSDEDMDSLNIPLPPNDMFERIMKSYNKDRNNKMNNFKKFKWKKVILIAAIITILIGCALSVHAVRMYIYKISFQIMESGAVLFGNEVESPRVLDVEEKDAYAQVRKEANFNLLQLNYVPGDIKFSELKVYDGNLVRSVYSNENGSQVLTFCQESILEGSSRSEIIATENPDISIETINGLEVTIVKSIQGEGNEEWYNAVWNRDGVLYEMDANINIEEFRKIIKDLR